MESNFQFLEKFNLAIYKAVHQAELNALPVARTSAFYSRRALDLSMKWLYDHDESLTLPYDTSLINLMKEPSFTESMPQDILNGIHYVRKLGNSAVHSTVKIQTEDAVAALNYMFRFLAVIATTYSEERPVIPSFDDSILPQSGGSEKTTKQLEQMEKDFHSQQKELKRKEALISQQDEEIEKLKEELKKYQVIKATNEEKGPVITQKPYTEAETRRQFIDLLLREAGWDPKGPNVPEFEVEGMPTSSGKGYVDYVLWGDDGKPLALVEAKKTSEDVNKGKRQAELYANCLEKMFGQRPVIFYSTGFETRIWDDTFYPPRKVSGFYSKSELKRLIERRFTRKNLAEVPINRKISGRHYQLEGIKRIFETFEKKRLGALLVMATGTGKTRTAVAMVEALSKANWVKKVLFLADRNALVTQAKNAFTTHVPHLSSIDLTKEKEDEATRLVFSTYPTMMNRIDGQLDGDQRLYDPGHFDLIIIDEAHRSVYVKYRAIFEFFDALTVGLTATPKSDVDYNTYELFGLEDHQPTFAYELDEAVKEKFLVPPRAYKVPLKFPSMGIKYKELSDQEKEEFEMTFEDDEGHMPEEIGSGAVNQWLFNRDTVDKVLQTMMDHGLKLEGGDKLGKTIIFARNHNHAEFIEQRFNYLYPEKGGKFMRVIDNYDPYAQSTLDDFSIAEKYPQIAASVDMLDTGIDIPEILNLVFFKPVKSYSKFWQMIGRGTRLREDLFGPGKDKKYFLIFDVCGNFDFFDVNPEGIQTTTGESLSQKIFRNRLDLFWDIRKKDSDEINRLKDSLLDHLCESVKQLNEDSFSVRMEIQYVDHFKHRSVWNNLGIEDKHNIEEHIIKLVMPSEEDDEYARRFDLTVLNWQLEFQKGGLDTLKVSENLQPIVKELMGKSSIPKVMDQMDFLMKLSGTDFWKSLDLFSLEEMRVKLRDLMQFLDRKKGKKAYTTFEDSFVGEVAEIDVGGYSRLESYRDRVERFIREHQDNLAIRKLRTNEAVTESEIQHFEKILFDGEDRGSLDDFKMYHGEEEPLGVFIRSLVGLDVNAAKEAFAEFIGNSQLTADQINFINVIIDHLTVNGTIDKRMLFKSPFTDMNDQGLLGVFDDEQAGKIVKILDGINGNAMVG